MENKELNANPANRKSKRRPKTNPQPPKTHPNKKRPPTHPNAREEEEEPAKVNSDGYSIFGLIYQPLRTSKGLLSFNYISKLERWRPSQPTSNAKTSNSSNNNYPSPKSRRRATTTPHKPPHDLANPNSHH
jgi:hypothetical protein